MRHHIVSASIIAITLGAALAAQTAQPDLKLPIGGARLIVDIKQPEPTLRVVNLPAHTITVCTLFASVDEKLEGQTYVPRHCWYGDVQGTFNEDWDFIPINHFYDLSVEYQVLQADGQSFKDYRTPVVRVAFFDKDAK